MHRLTINNIPYSIPGSWNELTQQQLLQLVTMYNKKYNLVELSVKLLLVITGLKVVFIDKYEAKGSDITSEAFEFRHGSHHFIIDIKDIIHAASKLDFLFHIEEIKGQKVYSLNSKLSRNLFPEIIFGMPLFREIWHGPADNFTNMILSEFIHAETAFDKLLSTSDEKYLDHLIAILYRPAGKLKTKDPEFRGDIREPFNDFIIDNRASLSHMIRDDIKIAILLFYTGSRYALTKIFPEVFSGSGSADTDTFRSYMGLIETLANYDITKKEEIRNAYLYDVLLTMNQSIIRDREWGKERKKPRRHV
jgi:hypothetical protein